MLREFAHRVVLSFLLLCTSGAGTRAVIGQDSFNSFTGHDGKMRSTYKTGGVTEGPRDVELYIDALHRYHSDDSKQSKSQLEAKLEASGKLDALGRALVTSNLGGFYISNRQYAQAEKCYRDALKTRLENLPQDSPEVAVSYHNLGAALEFQKKIDMADDMYQHSEKIWESLGPKYKANLATELENIGKFDSKLSRAEEALKRALLIREELKGKNDPSLLPALYSLGPVLEDQKKFSEAKTYDQRYRKLVKSLKSPCFDGVTYDSR